MRSAAQASLHDDALAGHLGRNGQADIGQHGGCDIGKATALAQLHVTAANCHKGHNVGSVGGEGGAVRVHHLFGVAVVGGDEGAAAGVQHSGDHLIHAGIHSLNGLDSSLEHAGVADHIAVCEVQDDHIVLAAFDALDALGSDFGGAHLGLQVVGGNLGAGDDAAILALVGSLHAAVEEEGDQQHHAVSTVDKISGQTLGKQFETLTMEFLRETFPQLQNLRPGRLTILQLGNNNKLKTSDFAQYEHLAYLNALTTQNAQLAAALGNDYLVAPDVVVYRDLCEDEEINASQCIVDDDVSKMADIRKSNGGKPILHASVSAKYTMRSDRAQNSRTEALNLIRNRKGHLPHIVVVTAEPMPNRLASLALGTGDIDCVYHFALYELIRAVKEVGSEDAVETLETLVKGKRLKDISDLPLDLSV